MHGYRQFRLSFLPALLAAIVTLPAWASDGMVDGVSLEVGTGTKVHTVRAGLQSNWEKRWFASNGTHLGGYWDLSLARWRGTAYLNVPGQTQHAAHIGLTPVFRFQSDSKKRWYAEGGIGLNMLSENWDNDDDRLSTRFQFGDHIGAGFVTANGWDVGLKLQHFSNGGFKRPNSGVNFILLKVARQF